MLNVTISIKKIKIMLLQSEYIMLVIKKFVMFQIIYMIHYLVFYLFFK